MTNKKWLLQEMEQWQQEGIIGAETRGVLERRYATDVSSVSWRQIVLCSLGALLIGCGVIALLASNWDFLSRGMRAVIAILPLTLCVGAYILGLRKGWRSLGFLEPLGIFWGISAGAGIALIAQTYQISGDEEAFAMAWTLMLLPVLYATRSVSVGIGYFIGLLTWASLVACNKSATGMMYWPLACFAIPFIASLRKASIGGIRTGLMTWGAALCSTAALGVTLENTLPGLWMVTYCGAFASLLLGGIIWEPKNESMWQTPMRTLGGCGLAVLLYLLTFEWPWEEIGREYWRHRNNMISTVSLIDYTLAILALGIPIVLLVIACCKKQDSRRPGTIQIFFYALLGIAPLVVAAVYYALSAELVAWSYSNRDIAVTSYLPIAIYLGSLGLATIANGLVRGRMLYVNGGVVIVLGLILDKFFTSDFSFTVKGISFIVCGCLFFAVNMLASRQMKKAGGAQ